MNDQEKFANELATRIAMHEILLEKVFAQWIAATQNPTDTMARLLESLQISMQNLSPPAGLELTPEHLELITHQQTLGQELAANFVRKVSVLVNKA